MRYSIMNLPSMLNYAAFSEDDLLFACKRPDFVKRDIEMDLIISYLHMVGNAIGMWFEDVGSKSEDKLPVAISSTH